MPDDRSLSVGHVRRLGGIYLNESEAAQRRRIGGDSQTLSGGFWALGTTHPQSLTLAMDLRSVSIEARTSPDCNRFVTT